MRVCAGQSADRQQALGSESENKQGLICLRAFEASCLLIMQNVKVFRAKCASYFCDMDIADAIYNKTFFPVELHNGA
jgi:hypothetical protein